MCFSEDLWAVIGRRGCVINFRQRCTHVQPEPGKISFLSMYALLFQIIRNQDMNIYYTTLPLTLYLTHDLVPCGPGQDLAFLMYHFQIYSQLVSYNYILSRVCFSRIWWGHGCKLGNIKMIVWYVQFGSDQTLWSKCVIFPLNIQL